MLFVIHGGRFPTCSGRLGRLAREGREHNDSAVNKDTIVVERPWSSVSELTCKTIAGFAICDRSEYMRDEFAPKTKETLALRVAYRCSNPHCQKPTSGPQIDPAKVINVGVAAHITGAAPRGKRYDPSLSRSQRKSIDNGIWLCQTCAKLIDSDERRYTIELLRDWKCKAEQKALLEIGTSVSARKSKAELVRQRDLGTLRLLFEHLHTPAMDDFFFRGQGGCITDVALYFFEDVQAIVTSGKFHIYNQTLERKLSSFFTAWRASLNHSGDFYPLHSGLAYQFIVWKEDSEERVAKFIKELDVAKRAYRDLVKYVRKNYPELDINQTDAVALNRYVKDERETKSRLSREKSSRPKGPTKRKNHV